MTNLVHDLFNVNISGFEFLGKISENLTLTNTISDYPTESGNTINDNIASKPLELSIVGVVSDTLVKIPFANLEKKAIGTIGEISALAPDFASKAQSFVSNVFQDINKAINFAENIKNAGLALFHIIAGNDNGNKAKFLEFILKSYKNKDLMTVTFNNASFENMVISDCTVEKTNDDDALLISFNFKQYTAISNSTFNLQNSPISILSNEAKKMIGNIHIGGLSL